MFCDFLHSHYICITQFHPRCFFFFLDAFSNIINLFSICGWCIKIQLLCIDLVSRGIGKLNSNDLPIDSTRSSYIRIMLSMSSFTSFQSIWFLYLLPLHMGILVTFLISTGKQSKFQQEIQFLPQAFYCYS